MNIFIDIYWIKVKVFTKNTSLATIVRKYYSIFLVDTLSNIDVDIDLERNGYFSWFDTYYLDEDFVTFWDYIKINKGLNKYFFENQEIFCLCEFGKTTKVKWILTPGKIRHFINIALQGFTRIDKYYNRFLIKTCIHDIIFILLEKKLQSCLLHATAVTNGENTYVFTWLWGSGKSTLASAFSKLKWYKILSDNYALVSNNRLYAFPELPRITKDTQKLLQIKLTKKADGIKHYLENDLSEYKKEYKIDKVFICSYGNDFKIKKIDKKDYLFEVLSSINHYTKEFPEYLNFSLASIINKFNTNNQRIESLKKVIENNDFYLLQNNSNLEDNLNKIIHV